MHTPRHRLPAAPALSAARPYNSRSFHRVASLARALPSLSSEQRPMYSVQCNLWVAWAMMAVGILVGAGIGLFFQKDTFLGGYASWRRRLLRLGHIACFGLAFINIAFALSAVALKVDGAVRLPAALLIAANVLMPATCFAAAWRKGFANLFVVPVGCTLVGVVTFLLEIAT
jgi:hypothetical protein